MRRPAFSSRAPPASRSSFGGDLPAPPSFSHLAIDFARSGRGGNFFMLQPRLMSGEPLLAGEPLCNCGQRFAIVYTDDNAMRQPMPTTRDGAVVLLAQPLDAGLHIYADCLCKHGLAVIAVSEAWDALIAAPKADIIVTEILLAGSMDGVGLIGRLRRNERAERRPIIVLTEYAWDAERRRHPYSGARLS